MNLHSRVALLIGQLASRSCMTASPGRRISLEEAQRTPTLTEQPSPSLMNETSSLEASLFARRYRFGRIEASRSLSAVRNFLRSAFPRAANPIAFFPLRFPFYRLPPVPPSPLLPSSFRLCSRHEPIAYRKGRFCTRVTGNVPGKLYP